METVPVLVVTEGPLKGQRFRLLEGEGNTIGRSEECFITIPDPDVSRQHALVILHNGGVWVKDDNSRNGVYVNGKRVARKPHELRKGGQMTIGCHVFVLEQETEMDDVSLVLPKHVHTEQSSNKMWILLGVLSVIGICVVLFSIF